MKTMRKGNDEIPQLAKVKKLKKLKKTTKDLGLFVYGHVTIFQIRLQTMMKLVGQAKYPSI
jgi:hypothetical protein